MVLRPGHVASSVVDKHTGASPAVGPRALAALHELAVAASGVLEPTALAKHAVDLACDLLGVDGAALYWWVSSTGLLHSLADNRGYQAGASRTLEVGKGVAGLAFQRQEPLIIDDYPKWECAVPWALEHGVRAAVGIPLLARGRTVGAMAVLTHAVGGFDADDLRLLSLLAAQVAPSLEAGRLDIDLAASEQRFRSLYGSVASGVLVLSASGVIIQVNPAGERIIGLSAEEMRGKTPDQLWHAYAEDGSELKSTDRVGPVVLRSRQPVQGITNKIVLPNGRVRWVLIDAIPVMGPDGQALQVVASFLDITERKQVEEALRESEERFRAVFNRAAVGIARIDLGGQIIEANPALQRMLGYSADELTHNPLATFVHPDYVRDGRLAQLTELAEGTRQELQQELRYVHKLGGLVWCNSIASLVRGPSNEPLFLIVMTEDITARKKQEVALEHLALHDGLTDLPNRTLMFDRLRQAILVSKREHQALALLMMDLDEFKEINDTFGHHGGDAAMYEAKRAGTGTAFYTLEHDIDSSGLTLTFELRRAIEENALILHYQPVLRCGTGEVVGVEALVRWPHPRHGLLAPDRFIPLAEQSRLIRPLGRRVLEAAVQQQDRWWRAGITLRMAVYLSIPHPQDPELGPCVQPGLDTYTVPPDWLTLEITESTLMADTEETLKVLAPLKAMGVRVSIDDFGTGFSSLTNLKRLPIDELKIDKTFVTEMPSKKKDGLIVRSTIDLAHALGLVAVAEGVEEASAWDMLAAQGCDLAQGYYICRPLPAADVVGWYQSRSQKAA